MESVGDAVSIGTQKHKTNYIIRKLDKYLGLKRDDNRLTEVPITISKWVDCQPVLGIYTPYSEFSCVETRLGIPCPSFPYLHNPAILAKLASCPLG